MTDDLISRQAAVYLLEHEIELSNRALDFAELVGTEREKFSWGLGLLESIAEDIKQLPSAEQNRIARETAGKSPDEIYEFLYWLMSVYGMQFTDTRAAVIEWLKGERKKDG